ncbi:MAG TPA: DUF4296 domain-containing protein [Flavisolibacter sp.]|jgi:hypothetical protein|nr:DUF4296 domain-containing protein [Flavisolibacter sp.]
MRYWIVICLFIVACSGESVPKDVLPPEKMQAVMYDVIRVDEMVDFLRMSDSAYQPFTKRTALYDTVFGLHSVTKERFQQSLKYYQGRPDLLKDIMDNIHTKITDTANKKPVSSPKEMLQ